MIGAPPPPPRGSYGKGTDTRKICIAYTYYGRMVGMAYAYEIK